MQASSHVSGIAQTCLCPPQEAEQTPAVSRVACRTTAREAQPDITYIASASSEIIPTGLLNIQRRSFQHTGHHTRN
jgi:hypothetical protein